MAKFKKESNKKSSSIYKIIYIFILILVIGFGSFFFVRYLQVNSKYKDVTLTQDQRNENTLQKVGKLMDLPKDEKPVLAVVDKNKIGKSMAEQKFLEKAKTGDIVIAYKSADLSVIYRPSENRIIKTDNYNNYLAAQTAFKVAIIAPTDQQQETEKMIKSKLSQADVVTKHAPVTSVTQNTVVDATGTNTKATKELADKLGMVVGQLPEGEKKPENVAFIIIMGSAPSAPPATP